MEIGSVARIRGGVRLVLLCACLFAPPIARPEPIVFTVNVTDAPGEGFNDPQRFEPVGGNTATTLGAARRNALQHAANLWGSLLNRNYVGESIVIDAAFDPLGGTALQATLGQARPAAGRADFGSEDPDYRAGTVYPVPLANHLHGSDLRQGAEIQALFNADVDSSTVLGPIDFYYGLDGARGNDLDFVTVALHELAHGLGFVGQLQQDGTFLGGRPGIYDRLLFGRAERTVDGQLRPIFLPLVEGLPPGSAQTPMNAAERARAITSGDLFWLGFFATLANRRRVELFAPAAFQQGSSIYHLDDATFPTDLMRANYSGTDHTPGAIAVGMLRDMGWNVVAEPPSLALAMIAVLLCLGLARRHGSRGDRVASSVARGR